MPEEVRLLEALIIKPKIELAQIISNHPCANLQNASAMYIGKSPKKNLYRLLFKIPIDKLPSNTTIISATLKINVTSVRSRYPNLITPYALIENWTIDKVTWDNSPSFDTEIFGDSVDVKRAAQYTLDITTIVQQWNNNEISNYGIVLKNDETITGALVKINNNMKKSCGPKVEIFYEQKCSCNCTCETIPTKFIEKFEEFNTKDIYSYSKLRNTSLTKTVTYFVENLGIDKIKAHLQVSPDGVTFINEPAQIFLDMNEMKFLVPCIFSKFTRVAVKNINCTETSKVKIWYLAQE